MGYIPKYLASCAGMFYNQLAIAEFVAMSRVWYSEGPEHEVSALARRSLYYASKYGVHLAVLENKTVYMCQMQKSMSGFKHCDRIVVADAHILPNEFCTAIAIISGVRVVYQTEEDRADFVKQGFADDLSDTMTDAEEE